MKRPFVVLTIFLMIGLVIGYYVNINIIYAIMLLSLLTAVIVFLKKGCSYILFVAIVVFGIIIMQVSLNKSELTKYVNQNVVVSGIIIDKFSQNEYSTSWIMKADKLYVDDIVYEMNEKMLVKAIGESITIKKGDYIEINSTIQLPNTNTNPKLFDYRLYLMMDDIYVNTKCKPDNLKIVESDRLSIVEKFFTATRDKLYGIFDSTLSEECSKIAKAVVFSDKHSLDERDEEVIRDIGIAHIIAVSGFHVWILSALIFFILKLFITKKRTRIILCLIILWSYGAIICFPPSVLRALIMLSCGVIADVLYRKNDSFNCLGLAGFIILVYKPLWIFSVGFQLSFSAALSLLLLTPILQSKLKKSSISAIIAVQIGIVPVIVYHFNKIPVFAILVNALILPLISLIIVILFILLFVSLINIQLGFVVGFVCNGMILSFKYLSNALFEVIGLNILLPSFTLFEIIVYYIIILIIFGYIKLVDFNIGIKKVIFVYGVLAVIFLSVSNMLFKDYKIEFIDVGQGDCIHTKLGNKNFLIDTGGVLYGSFNTGEKIVLPYLLKNQINHLDGMFISHFDVDHCGGATVILDSIKVDKLFVSYIDYDNELVNEIIKKAQDEGTEIEVLKKNDDLIIDENTNIKIIYPHEGINSNASDNNKSLIMLMNIYNTKILFTGDIENEAEEEVAFYIKDDIDILKVAHHGSNTSSSTNFLEKCKPEYGIISVGNNNYGHPHKLVINRLNSLGIRVLRTDKDGLITAKIDEENYSVENYNKIKYELTEILKLWKELVIFSSFVLVLAFFITILSKEWNDEL